MKIARRQMMLASLSFGLAALALQVMPRARKAIATDGGAIDQTAALQTAIDRAVLSGNPLLLPAGLYETGPLTLRSGARIRGVPGRTILRSHGGESIFIAESADNVGLRGLVLDGGGNPFGGPLLEARETKCLDVTGCRFHAAENAIVLRGVSGRITSCEIGNISKAGLVSAGAEDLLIAANLIDRAAIGVALGGETPKGKRVVVRDNVIRDLFMRKNVLSGIGIHAAAGSVVRGNLIDGAPAYGILIGEDTHDVSLTENIIRNAYIDVAVSAPLSRPGAVT